ncbi:hypothetical protein GCK72_012444 [Caenorhabditis remanei]|uniref:Uncharacterized protein n=1 Tax=Caenorhabditis remanei TaxID=31234 RepID=A0A6A5GN07_CAERE|nr:hypothetical protein GCK72_012444 [Caenorhabditis remanei]KAF1755991.1 hypothetical protein GCK72_012444 [Caenorhabditis remanei]
MSSPSSEPGGLPIEKERLLRKAQKENPTAYSTVVTLTDSDEEIEIIVPRQPESVESPGSSSSDASARPSPEVPKAPAVLRDSEIQEISNLENENRRENEEDAIALIGQSMHPTRAAVKQLRGKNPNEGQAGQGWTSGAPAVKKPRKTARLQQVKRGGDGKK